MKYFLLSYVFMLSACQTVATEKSSPNISSVMNLIAASEANASKGITGTFQFFIKASGISNGFIYLNTELDYRDRRSLSISISPNIVEALTNKYGAAPEVFFINKIIEVKGKAKRQTIYFSAKGVNKRKYYFQTHVVVSSIDDIKVLQSIN